jgi:SanA protein
VTDDFHLPRSLWLADRRGLKATGFCGPALPWKVSGKARIREWLARINAGLDEWVLGTGAKHYGERETLNGSNPEQTAERRHSRKLDEG